MPNRNDTRDSGADGRKVAVALSYESAADSLPRVVATGKGAIAEQILALAFENGVRVREDRELAEMLSVVQIDSEIPVEAVMAVAEILSYLYRAGGLKRDSVEDLRR